MGPLTADHEPKISFDKNQNKNVGKYTGDVTFTQRFRVEPGAPKSVAINGTINFLYCNEDNCIPKKEKIEISSSGQPCPSRWLPRRRPPRRKTFRRR